MNKDKFIKTQKGSILVLVTIMLPMFIMFAFLAVNMSYLYVVKNKMQTAVDAGAIAAVTSINVVTSGNVATATSVAKTITGSNGFTHGTNAVTVTVSIPPGDPFGTSPTYASNSTYARVQISQTVSTFFSGIMGIPTVTVTANAVAGPSGTPAAVVALAASGSSALSLSGSGKITTIGGSVGVNSSSSDALKLTGSSIINASSVNVVGTANVSGSSTVNGTLNTSASATGDPFASLTLPTAGSCDYTNYTIGNSNSATLSPGTYCGGIKINGAATVNLNPGTYILYGGGLSVTNGGTIKGTGVTFYNTGTASGGNAYGSLNVAGAGHVTLTAPTSGTYLGMLFIQDPLNNKAAAFSNGSSGYIAGNIYIPKGTLTFSGAGTLTQPVGIVVALKITVSGSANLQASTQYGGGSVSSSQISLYE
jgi:Flp pilus assembly protein TadG